MDFGIISLGDYVNQSKTDFRLKRTTHDFVADTFSFYKRDELFPNIKGLEKEIMMIEQYFAGAREMGSLNQRLILFLGPQSTGKTTLAKDLQRAVINYSQTESGLLMAVDGCPFNQHPYDLVPREEREKQGIEWHMHSVACPVCEATIEKYKSYLDLPVRRLYIGPRSGIGEHISNDPRKEDETEFLGNLDYSKLATLANAKSNSEAYDWNGKLIWANRGLFYWEEMLKSRQQILTMLLNLTQDKKITYKNFPPLSVDMIVIGATNFGEYDKAVAENILEPLFGRAYVVEFKYVTDKRSEVGIYKQRLDKINRSLIFKRGKSIECINPFILENYIAEIALESRKKSGGKNGLAPRLFEDIMSIAHSNAVRENKNCISFDTYLNALETVMSSERLKKNDLGKYFESFETFTETLKESMRNRLHEIIVEDLSTFEDFRCRGQAYFEEYIRILKKKQRSANGKKDLTETDVQLLNDIYVNITTKSKIPLPDPEAFERTFLAYDEDKLLKMDYRDKEEIRYAINKLIGKDLEIRVRNALSAHSSNTGLVTDLKKILTSKNRCCDECGNDLLYFLAHG